jgi:hypothetical protein
MGVTQDFHFSQFSPIHIPTSYFLDSHLSTMPPHLHLDVPAGPLPSAYLTKTFTTFIVLDIVVQTGPGVHPASYPMGTKGSFPGGKAAGVWSWALTSN